MAEFREFYKGITRILGSIEKLLTHWPLTEKILGSNPFDGNFLASNSTRMHSSRMRTACSSSRHGGGGCPNPLARSLSTSPLGVGLDQIPLNFPLGCGFGPDPPQLPPWVWAWTRSPSTSPLGVGLETPPLGQGTPLGPGVPQDQAPPETRSRHPPGPGTPQKRHPPDQAPPGTRHPFRPGTPL